MTHATSGKRISQRSGPDGIAELSPGLAGLWMVSATLLQPKGSVAGQWSSEFSTLVIEIAAR